MITHDYHIKATGETVSDIPEEKKAEMREKMWESLLDIPEKGPKVNVLYGRESA